MDMLVMLDMCVRSTISAAARRPLALQHLYFVRN